MPEYKQLPEEEMKRFAEIREAFYALAPKLTPIEPDKNGVIEYHGRRFVLINYVIFHDVVKALEQFVGEAMTKRMTYDFGYNAGKNIAVMFKRSSKSMGGAALALLKSGFDLKTLEKIKGDTPFEMCAKIVGYGKHSGFLGNTDIVCFDTDNHHYIARIRNTFVAAYYRNNGIKAKEPVCHFIAGVVGGVVSELVGEEIVVRETKCEAMGDDYCEFVGEKAKS